LTVVGAVVSHDSTVPVSAVSPVSVPADHVPGARTESVRPCRFHAACVSSIFLTRFRLLWCVLSGSLTLFALYGLFYNWLPWMLADAILYIVIVYACAEPFLYVLFGSSYNRFAVDLLRALIQ
jgi:hypothetical protein